MDMFAIIARDDENHATQGEHATAEMRSPWTQRWYWEQSIIMARTALSMIRKTKVSTLAAAAETIVTVTGSLL